MSYAIQQIITVSVCTHRDVHAIYPITIRHHLNAYTNLTPQELKDAYFTQRSVQEERKLSRLYQSPVEPGNVHLRWGHTPESQCGFRKGRGTADMIFAACQFQDFKCLGQNRQLYTMFAHLTKALDTVS